MVSRQYFQGETPPDTGNNDPSVTVGTAFGSQAPGRAITHVMYWQAPNTSSSYEKTCGVYQSATGETADLLLTSVNHTPVGSGWQMAELPSPVAMLPASESFYVVAVWYQNAGYAATGAYFDGGLDKDKGDGLVVRGPSRFAYGSELGFPVQSFNNANYWVDAMVSGVEPPAPTGPLVRRRAANQFVDVSFVRRRQNGIWVPATVTKT